MGGRDGSRWTRVKGPDIKRFFGDFGDICECTRSDTEIGLDFDQVTICIFQTNI